MSNNNLLMGFNMCSITLEKSNNLKEQLSSMNQYDHESTHISNVTIQVNMISLTKKEKKRKEKIGK